MARDFLILGTVLGPIFFNEVAVPHCIVPQGGPQLEDRSTASSPSAPASKNRTTTVPWQNTRNFLLLGDTLGQTMLGVPGFDMAVPGYAHLTDSTFDPYSYKETEVFLRQVTDALGTVDQLPARGPVGARTRDGIFREPLGITDANFPLMRHTIKWWQRLYIEDSVVATRVLAAEGPPPTIVSTTHLRQYTETLEIYDRWLDFVNGARLHRVRDTLRITDLTPKRTAFRSRFADDWLTLIDSWNDGMKLFYTAAGQAEASAFAEWLGDRHIDGLGGAEASGYGDTWHDYGIDGLGLAEASAPARYRPVELTVTGVPAGFSARVVQPNNTVVATATASMGRVVLELTVAGVMTSGTLQLFSDPDFSLLAAQGVIGPTDLYRGNIWDYQPSPYFLKSTLQSVYIERPWGGWTAPGCARVEREEFVFSTYTDSSLEGLGRGANATTATSHSGIVSLGLVGLYSYTDETFTTITSYLAHVNSTRYLQDAIPILVNCYDELYIGASSRFSAAHLQFARNASARMMLLPTYSIGEGTWASFQASSTVKPFDTTSGFATSGAAYLEPPGNWEPTGIRGADGLSLGDGVSRYYLRFLRMPCSLSVLPSLMDVTLTADTVVTKRIRSPYLYTPTLQDSGQVLYFKVIARSLTGAVAPGDTAPVAVLDRRPT